MIDVIKMSIITFLLQLGLHTMFLEVDDIKTLLLTLGLRSKAMGFVEFPLFIVSPFCTIKINPAILQNPLCKSLCIYIMHYDMNMQMTI